MDHGEGSNHRLSKRSGEPPLDSGSDSDSSVFEVTTGARRTSMDVDSDVAFGAHSEAEPRDEDHVDDESLPSTQSFVFDGRGNEGEDYPSLLFKDYLVQLREDSLRAYLKLKQRAIVVSCFRGVGEDAFAGHAQFDGMHVASLLPLDRFCELVASPCVPGHGNFYYGSSDEAMHLDLRGKLVKESFRRRLLAWLSFKVILLVPDGKCVVDMLEQLGVRFVHVAPKRSALASWCDDNAFPVGSDIESELGCEVESALDRRKKLCKESSCCVLRCGLDPGECLEKVMPDICNHFCSA